jgi:aminoglycoside phosphotransferase (APT) family kinase protein
LVKHVAEGMNSRRTTLVHGDYSPKNILADGDEVVILDFEVTHWGDPRFDVGFCASHLLLKAIRADDASKGELARTVDVFLDAYSKAGPMVLDDDFVQITGCLMLARIQGASPVEYLSAQHVPRVLALASRLIRLPGRFTGRPPSSWEIS